MDSDRTRLYLTRHGEVVNHGVYNGQTDVDITEQGVRQMERLRGLLQGKPLGAIYSSDLLRTRKGAEIIGAPHGLEAKSFAEFREVNFGRWQGLTYPQVMEQYPTDIPQWMNQLEVFRIPEGKALTMSAGGPFRNSRSWSKLTAGRRSSWSPMERSTGCSSPKQSSYPIPSCCESNRITAV